MDALTIAAETHARIVGVLNEERERSLEETMYHLEVEADIAVAFDLPIQARENYAKVDRIAAKHGLTYRVSREKWMAVAAVHAALDCQWQEGGHLYLELGEYTAAIQAFRVSLEHADSWGYESARDALLEDAHAWPVRPSREDYAVLRDALVGKGDLENLLRVRHRDLTDVLPDHLARCGDALLKGDGVPSLAQMIDAVTAYRLAGDRERLIRLVTRAGEKTTEACAAKLDAILPTIAEAVLDLSTPTTIFAGAARLFEGMRRDMEGEYGPGKGRTEAYLLLLRRGLVPSTTPLPSRSAADRESDRESA